MIALLQRSRTGILVVDDDEEFLRFVVDGLRDFDVATATTPLSALWFLQRHRVRAIVCDLVLGASDGRHLLELVQDDYPQVARILVTGFGARLSGLGGQATFPAAQAVVHKPCSLPSLAALLGDLPDLSASE